MKWKKLGKIFDPTNYQLPNNCLEFAQSPQTLVFDDFVRIYFSTREKDRNQKYLSQISFVDFNKSFNKILKVSKNPVIEMGGLGCFDEHGIFPLNIYRDNDRILGYIGGWSRRESVSIETSIGLSISSDNGFTFKRVGEGPVITSSLKEPFLVGDPFVCKFKDQYQMWYIYGVRWIIDSKTGIKERVYKIGHAISTDGISWSKDNRQIINDKLNIDECQAMPTVIKIGEIYHMFFCFRQAINFRLNRNSTYRIGYAFSEDLKNWIRDDKNAGVDISEDSWDSNMMCYPHVFHCEDKVYMLYNGNEFGRFGFGLAELKS